MAGKRPTGERERMRSGGGGITSGSWSDVILRLTAQGAAEYTPSSFAGEGGAGKIQR